MTTLLLSPRYTDDSIALWRAAAAIGWNVERLHRWRVPDLLDDDLVIYGEPLFAAIVSAQTGYTLLEPVFHWLATVPAQYLRREVRFCHAEDLSDIKFPRFIKPADDKCFPAQVYASAAEIPSLAELPRSTPALVSDVVSWTKEFRVFVLDNQPATLSAYLRDGKLDIEGSAEELREAEQFVRHILPELDLPPAAVLDVGLIKNEGWAIVEANPCWGSGIYNCDPLRVLGVLQRACRRRKDIGPDEARWVFRHEEVDASEES